MKLARNGRRFIPAFLLLSLLSVRPAHAVSKDMVQLQTQVQQLIDSLARLQSSNDQQMGVLKDLVQQTVDSVNKMSITINGMQLKLQNQGDAQAARNDQISGQVQALNDSLDELKARMLRMEKTLNDVQSQAANAALTQGGTGAAGTAPAQGPAPSGLTPTPAPTPAAPAPAAPANQPASAPGPAVSDLYRTAYGDYMAGKYPLATSEFADLVKAYPDDNLAGNALFYTGEIEVRAGKPTPAIKHFDEVIERYPDNAKIPAAHLHKGEALMATRQTDAGIRELRALVQRFPNSPEAAQARTRLAGLGVSSTARR